ncbi:MAG: type II secretion system major pseudopilin GspG [Deltaproteobacteria bacterium]|nr:type II secretion system major pseudopilin GspG [Deltaproteobacteria bacterium]
MHANFINYFKKRIIKWQHVIHENRKYQRGMNLLEIMVVLVIISLVASTVGVAVMKQLVRAKIEQTGVQIKNLTEALELYKLQFHNYPSTSEGLVALVSPKGNAQPFIEQVPQDPWGHEYVYIYPGVGNTSGFDLMSYGPDGVQGGGDDITNYNNSKANTE